MQEQYTIILFFRFSFFCLAAHQHRSKIKTFEYELKYNENSNTNVGTCYEGWGKYEGHVECMREYACDPFQFNVPGLIGDVDADVTCFDGIELTSSTTPTCGLACDSGFRAAYLPYVVFERVRVRNK